MRELFWDALTSFISLYPLYMSFVWLVGGLLFFFRWERKPRPRLTSFPFFSLVIAAHNEEGAIEEVVLKLQKLNYPNYEVIVVDDGSTDGTRAILDGLAEESGRWLKVIHLSPNSGKARALNTGILCSCGECIMVIDADCFLDRNALRMMAWHFVRFPRVGAVTGNPRIINRTSLLGKIHVG
ncbi:MAG: glycosyltransferase family 2 protein, partial [Endomicrobiales bacterium]